MAKKEMNLEELNNVNGGTAKISTYFSGLATKKQIKDGVGKHVWILFGTQYGNFESYKGGTITQVDVQRKFFKETVTIYLTIDNNNGRPHSGNDHYDFDAVEWYWNKI